MGRNMSDSARAYAALALMPLFFSSNLIIGRAAIATVEPWTLAFWRWFLAFLILLPFAAPDLRAHCQQLLREWKTILLLGILGMGVCGAGVYIALQSTTATNATLIYTSSPVVILLLEILFRGQRTSLRQVVGIALAVLGVADILLRGELARLIALDFNGGDLGMAGAAVAWATYSVILRRQAFAELPTLVLFAAIACAGWLLLLPFMLWQLVAFDAFPAGADAWLSIFGVAFISSVLAFSTYQYGVKSVGATVTGVFLYLLPVYGVMLAVIFLGEELHSYHAVGLLLVTFGVALATAPRAFLQRFAR